MCNVACFGIKRHRGCRFTFSILNESKKNAPATRANWRDWRKNSRYKSMISCSSDTFKWCQIYFAWYLSHWHSEFWYTRFSRRHKLVVVVVVDDVSLDVPCVSFFFIASRSRSSSVCTFIHTYESSTYSLWDHFTQSQCDIQIFHSVDYHEFKDSINDFRWSHSLVWWWSWQHCEHQRILPIRKKAFGEKPDWTTADWQSHKEKWFTYV